MSLETIVRNLAKQSAPVDSEQGTCLLCGANNFPQTNDYASTVVYGGGAFNHAPIFHERSCPWRQAHEWVYRANRGEENS